ncbi:MAG: conjugal transfer protein TraX [Lachnospiraceae bacterium]|nr:conjugal transfer protein TraX [Lachnospiraceae bacterium]
MNKSITAGQLKLLAAATMLVDHIGYLFFDGSFFYEPMRVIGRLSFPLYCFFLVEGLTHTRNVFRYMGRLLLFALLSELPFDLMVYRNDISFVFQTPAKILRIFSGKQNVLWTLLIGLIVIWICSKLKSYWFHIPTVFLGMMASYALATDYKNYGILIIYFFWAFPIGRAEPAGDLTDEYGEFTLQKVKLILCQIVCNLLGGVRQAFGACALFPLFLYRGEKGKNFGGRYFFYLFYPVHMLVLVGIYYVLYLM